MELLTGKEALNRIKGVLNPKFQVHGTAVDLTVKTIYAVDPVGQVDFGGSEYKPAGRVAVASLRYNREDKYEWWDLSRGCYIIEFNESLELPDNEVAMLETEERLLRAGASHPCHFVRGRVAPIETLLEVSCLRIQIKQNARTSRIRIFRLPAAVATTQGKMPAGAKNKRKK
jgi:deoxycytidine triphosphate deaminase